jgi:hypothetical protein
VHGQGSYFSGVRIHHLLWVPAVHQHLSWSFLVFDFAQFLEERSLEFIEASAVDAVRSWCSRLAQLVYLEKTP